MRNAYELEWKFPEGLALPSWVFPGTVAENAAFLHTKVREVALCCFSVRSCLDYTETDLPPGLASLGLSWHVHLPLDLAWEKGAVEAAEQCLALRQRLLFLKPYAFVLHPPVHCQDPRPFLETFAKIWYSRKGERIFLENSSSYDARLMGVDFLEQLSLSFCLDPAHAIIHRQEDLLDSSLPEYARLLHWNAPGRGERHRSLIYLHRDELCLYRRLARRLSPAALHVLEIFDWKGILQSLPVLRQILGRD